MSDLEQKIHALNEELNRVHTIDAAGLWQRMEKKRHRERRWTYGLQIAAGGSLQFVERRKQRLGNEGAPVGAEMPLGVGEVIVIHRLSAQPPRRRRS